MHAQHCCVVDQKLQWSVYLVANLLTKLKLLIWYCPVLVSSYCYQTIHIPIILRSRSTPFCLLAKLIGLFFSKSFEEKTTICNW